MCISGRCVNFMVIELAAFICARCEKGNWVRPSIASHHSFLSVPVGVLAHCLGRGK